MGNYASALQQHDRVLSVYERELPADHPYLSSAMGKKASSLHALGRLTESLSLFKAASERGRRVFQADSDRLLVVEGDMANVLSSLGKHEEAVEVHRHLLEVKERSPRYGPADESTLQSRAFLGASLVDAGSFSEATPLLRDSLAAYNGMGLGSEHPVFGYLPHHYGRALLGAGRPAEAAPMFQRSIDFTECKHGPFHHEIPDDLILLAEAFGQMGRGFGERLSLLDRAVSIRELSVGRDKDQDADLLAIALQACAKCYEEAGSLEDAEERWSKCVAAFEKVRKRASTCDPDDFLFKYRSNLRRRDWDFDSHFPFPRRLPDFA